MNKQFGFPPSLYLCHSGSDYLLRADEKSSSWSRPDSSASGQYTYTIPSPTETHIITRPGHTHTMPVHYCYHLPALLPELIQHVCLCLQSLSCRRSMKGRDSHVNGGRSWRSRLVWQTHTLLLKTMSECLCNTFNVTHFRMKQYFLFNQVCVLEMRPGLDSRTN